MTPPLRPNPKSALALLLAGLSLSFIASLLIGSRMIAPEVIWQALRHYDPGNGDHILVWSLRLPRSLLAISAGAALGLAGALMQSVTRNPLAEAGLLGINAGAALAVVLAAWGLGLSHIAQTLGFGWLGAGVAGLLVFFLGKAHRGETNPLTLILAGAGLSILLGAVAGIIILNSQTDVLDLFRHWGAGSLQNRSWQAALAMIAALAAGLLLALPLAPALNAMALGLEMGRALGVRIGRIWALSCIAMLILAGSATATAGPIVFLGLISGHMALRLFGADTRVTLPMASLIGALLLLVADILGRIIAFPDEVAAGIMVSLLGAPVFLWILHKMKLAPR